MGVIATQNNDQLLILLVTLPESKQVATFSNCGKYRFIVDLLS